VKTRKRNPGPTLPFSQRAPEVLRLLGGVLAVQWRRYRKRLKRCRRRCTEKAVHDSRIEIRRLAALLDLLGEFLPKGKMKPVRRALKRHLDSFGALRDTQMQRACIRRLTGAFPAAQPFDDWLRTREARFTGKTRQAIRRVKTKRAGRNIAACAKALRRRERELPPGRALLIVRRRISRAFARVTQLATAVRPEDTETIHRTRIAFKRFRYMVEALSPLWPAVTEKFCRAMHHHQSTMGGIQDLEVLLAALDQFRRKAPDDEAGGLRAELTRRREWLMREYLRAAGDLRQFWPLPGKGMAKRKLSST
jgi:CHAD domain-containing protein